MKNPCKLILTSATAAKYQCDGDPKGSELVKISDAVVAAQKLESKNYFTKKDQVRKALAAKLGNTTWKLAEVKHLIKQADGKVYDYKDDVTAMSAESSSTQDGKTYTDVNAKTLAFSADLETAKINDKQTVQIEWAPMKKGTGAKLLLRLKTGESSYQILSQSGALVVSEDGMTLTLSEDFVYDGTQNQKTTVFNRVK